MAGLICVAQTAEVTLTAATAKTVIQVVAPTNQRLKIMRWGAFFNGLSGTNEPVQVRLLRQTTAGTMSALTPALQVAGNETIQTTALHTATAEPSSGDILDSAYVHPQSGYEVLVPFNMPIEVPGGERIGIECTAPDGVEVRAKIIFEE